MKRSIPIGIITLASLFCLQAHATPITFNFTGTIKFVGSTLSGGPFALNQSVSGSLTYESTTPDANPGDPQLGIYNSAVQGATFSFGAYSGTAGSGGINIQDNLVSGMNTLDVFAARELGASGSSVNSRQLLNFSFQLSDFTASMFVSDALPTTVPGPFTNNNANTTFLILQFDPTGLTSGIVDAQVRATVDSLTLARQVPEPASSALLGLGALGLAAMRRKRV